MQYLERSSLAKTLETFEAEAADLGLPIQDEADTAKNAVEGTVTVANSAAAPIVSVSDADHLLGMFDNVYEDAFFKMWEDPEAVPHVHDTATYAKLNFRLHLYFCCRKISDGLASPAPSTPLPWRMRSSSTSSSLSVSSWTSRTRSSCGVS